MPAQKLIHLSSTVSAVLVPWKRGEHSEGEPEAVGESVKWTAESGTDENHAQ